MLEIDVDVEGEPDKSEGPVSNENTADTTGNTADTNENTADTNENIPVSTEKPAKVLDVAKQMKEESQATTQATSEEVRTNDEESRDTAANPSESNEQTEESPASQEGDTTDAPARSIYTAHTQLPLNASTDSSEERNSPHSMEVTYDFPSTGTEKVTILEKPEDDNLPCTNDTDDIPITCGQVVKNSQDDIEKNKENEEPKLNGDKSPVKADNIISDKTTGTKDVTVEDMLADFVDEINEEKTEA